MSFESFCEKITKVMCESGGETTVSFRHSDGKHIATFPDGMRITGNAVSSKVFVNWGSGHVAAVSL